MRMLHIILSSVVCMDIPYFSTLSDKRYDFLKNVTEDKKYILVFSKNSFELLFILRRNERDIIINLRRFACEVPVIIVKC